MPTKKKAPPPKKKGKPKNPAAHAKAIDQMLLAKGSVPPGLMGASGGPGMGAPGMPPMPSSGAPPMSPQLMAAMAARKGR